jgi:multiple sugar transport system ATP-binding protein
VLVGPSGCGKTTALRMVAGLEDISTGVMKIGDRVVNTLSPKDRDIAMVFQSYALYPHMSVADNISYGLRIRKMDKAEIARRVKKAADMLELGPMLDRKPKQLSGGQRQRVAMGRAIVREPQVFLMDEPLSNLDAKLRVQMRAEISQVQHDLNVTTLYVTHDQIEAMTMGDRVAVIKGGVLQQVGPPQFLYDNPTNIFVAGFIGSPPMNLGLGRVIRLGDGLGLKFGVATLALHPGVVQDHPALANWVDREIAVGVRSEDMDDANLVRGGAPENSTLDATVSLTEALGSEIVVHFDLDVPKVVTEDTKLLDKDSGADDTGLHTEKTRFVASFAPRSRVRINDTIKVVVDTERLHFFDPSTGLAVRD